ncbi:MFS transporter [Mycobacterium sp. TNTM28]|uniref:MFS transporter n=1 Tax=[Mycobacterium] fortunisiensis TaxID=2600579 RepID=A0ABS6KHJ2_9MYCO|nr:MFS transporter [[Mycobacterium] fortunisiensis]MBU9763047.1 MFS transporter [[Mycobacterium] fortunisiensis]
MPAESTTLSRSGTDVRSWLRSREFLGPVCAIGGVQLIASMDGPVVVFALTKIQAELGLSDAGRNWVITAYILAFGGLILLGGRLGDTIGRKRIFIFGVALFTFASVLCASAWDGGVLVFARLLQGAAGAIVAPTCVSLTAAAFPKGPARNAAAGVLGATAVIGAVTGLVVGGVLTGVSWRLAFVVNVPIGLLVIWLAATMLQETQKERMRLDVAGAVLATLLCTAAVFGLSMAPERGWLSATTIIAGLVTAVAFVALVAVETAAVNPIVPLNLFGDRNRLATFAAMFLVRGVAFALTVVIAVYVQTVMGYSPLRAGISFIPFAIAMAVGAVVSSRLVVVFSPRVVVIGASTLVLGAVTYGGLAFHHGIPYFPNLVVPMVVGAIGIGIINVPLGLSLIASVDLDRIGPASAIAVMLQSLGGPVVLTVAQIVITSTTLHLGGADGPVGAMTAAQLYALDHGYAYGLLALAGLIVVLGAVALLIRYSAQEVAHAQKVKNEAESAAPGP